MTLLEKPKATRIDTLLTEILKPWGLRADHNLMDGGWRVRPLKEEKGSRHRRSGAVRPVGSFPPAVELSRTTRSGAAAYAAVHAAVRAVVRAVRRGDFLRGLIEAMTAMVGFDHLVTPAEVELVRTIAASLHCPLPRAA